MRSSLWEISPGGGHTKSQSLFLFAQDQQELGPLSSLTPHQPVNPTSPFTHMRRCSLSPPWVGRDPSRLDMFAGVGGGQTPESPLKETPSLSERL